MSVLSKALSALSSKVRALEDGWFDWTRGVDTSGDPMVRPRKDVIGPESDGYAYLPARARNIRSALRLLPIDDPAEYTFIDMGSGKGRVVFLAAARPFRKIIGVEHSATLHQAAIANLKKLRSGKHPRERIELTHGDAGCYEFPSGNLVLFLFNPFGREVMGKMLINLETAMRKEERRVVVVMLWPELSEMLANVSGMRPVHHSRRLDIFAVGGMGHPRVGG
jgi:SAM-dependent methyltransferase